MLFELLEMLKSVSSVWEHQFYPRVKFLRPSQGFWGTGEHGNLFLGNRGRQEKNF